MEHFFQVWGLQLVERFTIKYRSAFGIGSRILTVTATVSITTSTTSSTAPSNATFSSTSALVVKIPATLVLPTRNVALDLAGAIIIGLVVILGVVIVLGMGLMSRKDRNSRSDNPPT